MNRAVVRAVSAASLLFVQTSAAGVTQKWVVSIPVVPANEVVVPGVPRPQRESIVGIKITVRGGAIASIADVPIGWNVAIDNDPSWNTSLTATVIVASAALGPEYVSKNLVTISSAPPPVGDQVGGPEVEVELALSADFEHHRRVTLRAKDLLVTKIAE